MFRELLASWESLGVDLDGSGRSPGHFQDTPPKQGIENVWSTVKTIGCSKGSLKFKKASSSTIISSCLTFFEKASKMDPKSSLLGRNNVLNFGTTFAAFTDQFLRQCWS